MLVYFIQLLNKTFAPLLKMAIQKKNNCLQGATCVTENMGGVGVIWLYVLYPQVSNFKQTTDTQ